MKTSKPLLLAIAIASVGLLAFALYLQYGQNMLPCPLCIIQRYLFAAIALICLIFAMLPRSVTKIGAGLGALTALGGVGVAGWHIWVKAHPSVSCGIDPLETSLNKIPTAELLPFLFKADGLCSTPYPPVFGLDIPQWSLIWFVFFALALIRVAFNRDNG